MDPKRPGHGLILLDKPVGLTSTQCVNRIKRKLGRVKIGHSGTLDPFATGLLPICYGRTTKLINRIQTQDKKYHAELLLGQETETQDSMGKVVKELPIPEDLTLDILNRLAHSAIGKQAQVPPMYSARKINGKRLYELARKNIVVERKAKEIEIYDFQILEYKAPVVCFSVTCSEGTYVRTLGADLAVACNTVGHLQNLRRVRIGKFDVKDAVKIDTLLNDSASIDKWILPSQIITDEYKSLTIVPEAEFRFRNAALTFETDYHHLTAEMECDEEVNIISEDGTFMGIGVITHREESGGFTLKTEKLIDIQTD